MATTAAALVVRLTVGRAIVTMRVAGVEAASSASGAGVAARAIAIHVHSREAHGRENLAAA